MGFARVRARRRETSKLRHNAPQASETRRSLHIRFCKAFVVRDATGGVQHSALHSARFDGYQDCPSDTDNVVGPRLRWRPSLTRLIIEGTSYDRKGRLGCDCILLQLCVLSICTYSKRSNLSQIQGR